MHIKKHLGFDALIEAMSMRFGQVEDTRKGKTDYSLHDCLMGGFAMMFLQDPSMLEFQRRFQRMHHRNNLKTIFGILNIPKDSQLRDVLDNCSPEQLNPVFTDFFRQLQKGRQLELYLCKSLFLLHASSEKVRNSKVSPDLRKLSVFLLFLSLLLP